MAFGKSGAGLYKTGGGGLSEVDVEVNGSAYGTATSSPFDVDVVDVAGNPVGSLSGGQWVVPGITDPNDITGIQLWMDGQDTSTFNGGSITNGTGVSQWTDKSPNGFTYDQGSASSRPAFTTNVFGTNSGVVFDGINDFLLHSNDSEFDDDGNGTWIIVGLDGVYACFTDFGDSNDYLYMRVVGNGQFWFQGNPGNTTLSRYVSDSNGDAANGSIYAAWYDGNYNLEIDNTSVGMTATVGSNEFWYDSIVGADEMAMGRLKRAGGENYFSGTICEAIYYNRVLSSFERNLLYNYLKNKYSL